MNENGSPESRRTGTRSFLLSGVYGLSGVVLSSIASIPLAGCDSTPDPVPAETAWSPDAADAEVPARGPMPFAESFSTGPKVHAESPSLAADPAADPAAVAAADEVERDLRRLSGLATSGDFMPDVDRDGTFVAFASRQQRQDFDLYRRSLLGRDVAPLVTMPGDQIMPAISPDGRFVAFASDSDGNWNVFIAPVAGGTPVRITDGPRDEIHPTWSPDGGRLAFTRRGEGGIWEVWTADVSRPGEAKFLADGFLPRWSPVATGRNGRSTILVQRASEGRSARWGLWAIEVQGSRFVEERPLVVARNAATIHPCWSPDAERIAFVTVVASGEVGDPSAAERSDLWTARADGTDRRLLTSGQARNMQPAWLRGRGGDRILFVTDRGGVDAVWSLQAPDLAASDSRLADGETAAE
jgi:TolB protein